ncbi:MULTISPECIES: hypothetical protein [unclassified Micromonospora]|uniref:hypothetical protein n=1 Tax=unclassified Micromonospora TaxID=2617518 RepID=UPI0033FE0A7D
MTMWKKLSFSDRLFWTGIVALVMCLAAAGHPRVQNGFAAAGIVLLLAHAWTKGTSGPRR